MFGIYYLVWTLVFQMMFKNTAYTEGFVAGTRCLTKRLQPKGEGNCLSNANGWEFGCYTNFIISFKQLTFMYLGIWDGCLLFFSLYVFEETQERFCPSLLL